MNEDHFRDIEKVLLYVSEARRRADDSATALSKAGAEEHLVEAVREAERELADLHRRLMQGTYWAVPTQQISL